MRFGQCNIFFQVWVKEKPTQQRIMISIMINHVKKQQHKYFDDILHAQQAAQLVTPIYRLGACDVSYIM